jgi:Zn-dependent membrane protease YugP
LDFVYLILLLATTVFSVWASIRVNTTFKKYSRVRPASGITGAEAARRVLDANGLYNVRIERIPGNLTDHFNPRTNTLALSDTTCESTSAAAIGVACHEAGHAVQHAEKYLPIKIRQAIIPLTNFGSSAGLIIFLVGVLLTSVSETYLYIAYIGVALFAMTAVFQLVTLPTEFNASKRAIVAIRETGILSGDELEGAKKVLSAAALTYVAALASSLSQVLRLLVILGANNRRRR